MQKRFVIPLLVAVAVGLSCLTGAFLAQAMRMSASPDSAPLASDTLFPDVTIQGDLHGNQAAYLGVDPMPGKFALHGLKAPVLIVEIFSMYCPFCQEDAPHTNELYRLIAERGLDDRIKFLGIGAGNSQLEVDIFRDKYGLAFPVFPDPDFAFHKACGQVGTPFFYVLEKDATAGGYVVRHTNLGRMDSPKALLDAALAHTHL